MNSYLDSEWLYTHSDLYSRKNMKTLFFLAVLPSLCGLIHKIARRRGKTICDDAARSYLLKGLADVSMHIFILKTSPTEGF